MGEYADYAVDEISNWYSRPPRKQSFICKHCGKKGLQWQSTERGWRLFDGAQAHVCDQYKAAKP